MQSASKLGVLFFFNQNTLLPKSRDSLVYSSTKSHNAKISALDKIDTYSVDLYKNLLPSFEDILVSFESLRLPSQSETIDERFSVCFLFKITVFPW